MLSYRPALRLALLVGLVFALVCQASLVATAATSSTKLAFVDLQEALMTINEGKKVKDRLEKMAKKKKKSIEALQDELQSLKDELEKQAPMMKEDVRRKKLTDFQEKMASFQEQVVEGQKELAQKEQELTRPILGRMIAIVEEMAKDMGYDMILEKGGVVFGMSNHNLTDELVKRYNAKHKSK